METRSRPPYSEEQRAVAAALDAGFCVKVSAVAGSGKTTTDRLIVESGAGGARHVLILMFNRALAAETRSSLGAAAEPPRSPPPSELSLMLEEAAIAQFGPEAVKHQSVTASTVHAAVQRLYGVQCENVMHLSNIVARDAPPAPRFASYAVDLLIFDEAQDISPLFMATIVKIIKDFRVKRVAVLGDERQCINEFQNADARYLSNFPELLARVAPPHLPCSGWRWKELTLTQTFRSTRQVCALINLLFGGTMLYSCRDGPRPKYHRFNVFQPWNMIKLIRDILKSGASLEDIALIAPSVNGGANAPLTRLIALLPRQEIPVSVARDEVDFEDESLRRGKLLITTIHKFKGRERRHVIVFGCDARAAQHFTHGCGSSEMLPNLWYVAFTRATECLYIVQSESAEPAPFFARRWDDLPQVCDMYVSLPRPHSRPVPTILARRPTVSRFGVSDLVRNTPDDLWISLQRDLHFDTEIVEPPSEIIEYPSFVRGTANTLEPISATIGTLVPMRLHAKLGAEGRDFELEMIDHLTSLHSFGTPEVVARALSRAREIASMHGARPLQLDCELAHILGSISAGNVHLLTQVPVHRVAEEFEDVIEECVKRLHGISPRARFEVLVAGTVEVGDAPCVVHGLIDCIDGDQPYEFKTKRNLSLEDERQCLVYAALREYRGEMGDRPFLLINARTGERRRIALKPGTGRALLEKLVNHRLARVDEVSDLEGLAHRVTELLPPSVALPAPPRVQLVEHDLVTLDSRTEMPLVVQSAGAAVESELVKKVGAHAPRVTANWRDFFAQGDDAFENDVDATFNLELKRALENDGATTFQDALTHAFRVTFTHAFEGAFARVPQTVSASASPAEREGGAVNARASRHEVVVSVMPQEYVETKVSEENEKGCDVVPQETKSDRRERSRRLAANLARCAWREYLTPAMVARLRTPLAPLRETPGRGKRVRASAQRARAAWCGAAPGFAGINAVGRRVASCKEGPKQTSRRSRSGGARAPERRTRRR